MEASSSLPVVALLHGLARGGRSMSRLSAKLRTAGYRTHIISYPSRRFNLETLVRDHVGPAMVNLCADYSGDVHFVTHSMGGILVGMWLNGSMDAAERARVKRVVMLAPPVHGSEIVDKLGGWWLFRMFNGPAGLELGTDRRHFETVPAETGVIAGTRGQPVLSWMLPKPNDGKVSVASTKLTGMHAFQTVPYAHTFIMDKVETEMLVRAFLETGQFTAY